ncbi:MAG TPA: tail fiber domain-containing protein, partial [Terriglobales bacterium]|nr:tail fiber domain-containing protein [Terriglobales bacterium]
ALQANTAGNSSSAFGVNALAASTINGGNSAFGYNALAANTINVGNAAFGVGALQHNNDPSLFSNASSNAAFGGAALGANTTGSDNSAFGSGALNGLTSGSSNIAVGQGAGNNFTGSESKNIDIGNFGTTGENNTIRIGIEGSQAQAFIAGISGVGVANATTVFVNTNTGQLGTISSSRRFKNDIVNMGAESDLLTKLRPVAFYYKPELDPTHARQYGLVAEEVAEIAPQLVIYDKKGLPQTVSYHLVNAMLLNEVQKQRRLVEAQQQENAEQRSTIARQQEQLAAVQEQLASFVSRKDAKIAALQQKMEAVMLRLTAVEKAKSVQPGTQLASTR